MTILNPAIVFNEETTTITEEEEDRPLSERLYLNAKNSIIILF